MTTTFEGDFRGEHLRIAIVASRFNEAIVERLVEGAQDCLVRHQVPEQYVTLVWVPGAFELPQAASRLARSGSFDAIVCLGAVIRGETPHFDYVASAAATGVTDVAQREGIPASFGVLTTDTVEQAEDRAGGKMGNKGFEAALAAIEMANLFAALPKPETEI